MKTTIKKKGKTQTGIIKMPKNKQQWQTYQQLGRMAKDLNRLPDMGEIAGNKQRSAPVELLRTLF